MTDKTFKAAVVQAAPVWFDLNASIDKAIGLIETASRQGASLVAFGECWLPGYPFWLMLDSPTANMPRIAQYQACSLDLNSEQAQRIKQAARDNDIYIVMGYSEYDKGSLYMGQSIIDAQGYTIANRRKLRPTLPERMIFGQGDGSHLAVHETELGRIGALNCWEHLQPLNRFAMYSQYEQVHVGAWPTNGIDPNTAYAFGEEVTQAINRSYAVEGQCFVLTPNTVFDNAAMELASSIGGMNPFLPGGGLAMVYGPDGRELCEALPATEEGIVYADIHLSLIDRAKILADPVGHYSRPDVTRLLFNKEPLRVVENMVDHTSLAVPGENEKILKEQYDEQ